MSDTKRCIWEPCVATWRHWHGGFPAGYDNPDDPTGPPIPFEGDDPEPNAVRDYNGGAFIEGPRRIQPQHGGADLMSPEKEAALRAYAATPQPEPLSAEEEAALRRQHEPYMVVTRGLFGSHYWRCPVDGARSGRDIPKPPALCDAMRLLATLDAAREQAATEARRELLATLRVDATLLANAILGGTSYLPHREAAERVLRRIEEAASSPSTEEPTDG